MRKQWEQWQTLFSWASKSLQMVTAAMELRYLLLGRKAMTNLDRVLKIQRHYFVNKGPHSQNCGFSSSRVWMWELKHRSLWEPQNWCFWTVMLEKTLESPLDIRRSGQSILKEVNLEYSLEGLMLKLKLLILWPPDVKNWFTGKDPDAGKDWRQEKGTTEDEMVG